MSRVRADGARVMITGEGSGIGEATALRFVGAGAEIVAVDIDGDAAQRTAERARRSVRRRRRAEDRDWLRAINLDGVAYGCHAFADAMVRRGRGHVVNVASSGAYIHNRNMAAYCASKAAVVALSRCLRADRSDSGVGMSVICPGLIDTPIARHTRMVGDLGAKRDRIARAFRLRVSFTAPARVSFTAPARGSAGRGPARERTQQAIGKLGFESDRNHYEVALDGTHDRPGDQIGGA